MRMTPKSVLWYKNNILRLSNDNETNRIQILEDLKISLMNMNAQEISEIVSNVQLERVFNCLDSSNVEQVELAVKVLEHMFTGLQSSDLLEKYGMLFVKSMKLSQDKVTEFILRELKKYAVNNSSSTVKINPMLYTNSELLTAVVHCVAHKSIGIAGAAMYLLKNVGRDSSGLAVLYNEPVLSTIKEVLNNDDVIRFRMYEVIIEICLYSANHFVEINSRSLLDGLIKTLNDDDILTKLSTLSELEKLAVTAHGYSFLENNGFFSFLFSRVGDLEDTYAALLISGIFKFFGAVAKSRPQETFTKFPDMVSTVFQLAKGDNLDLQKIALDTIGFIAEISHGKLALMEYKEDLEQVLRLLHEMIETRLMNEKVVALNCVSGLMALHDIEPNETMLKITEEWFSQIFTSFRSLFQLCESPIPDIKIAAMLILEPIATLSWGQTLIANTPGCPEMLLSREETADIKIAKYNVISKIVSSSTSKHIFPLEILHKLNIFIRLGHNYVEPIAQVAMERAM